MYASTHTYKTEMRIPSVRETLMHEYFRARISAKRDIKFFPRIHMETQNGFVIDQPTLYYQKDGHTYIIDARDEAVDHYNGHPDFTYVHYISNARLTIPDDLDRPMELIPASQRIFFCEHDVHFAYQMFRTSCLTGFLPQNHNWLTYRIVTRAGDEDLVAIVFKTFLIMGEEGEEEVLPVENIVYVRRDGSVSMVDPVKKKVDLLGHIIPI